MRFILVLPRIYAIPIRVSLGRDLHAAILLCDVPTQLRASNYGAESDTESIKCNGKNKQPL